MKNNTLGRGLSSLLKEETVPIQVTSTDQQFKVKIDFIEANQNQPRKYFDTTKIRELSDSIAKHGVVQPIIVVKIANNRYQIVAGERRFRASKLAGLQEIPVIIKDLNYREILEISLIENIQRENLNVIEEAETLQRLINLHDYTQNELSISLGKSRSHIANLLRLNHLPNEIKLMVQSQQLSMGHARCLIGVDHPKDILTHIIDDDLSVRQTEELVNKTRKSNKLLENQEERINEYNAYTTSNNDVLQLGKALSKKFGVKVVIDAVSNDRGKISFCYNNLEELDLLLSKLD